MKIHEKLIVHILLTPCFANTFILLCSKCSWNQFLHLALEALNRRRFAFRSNWLQLVILRSLWVVCVCGGGSIKNIADASRNGRQHFCTATGVYTSMWLGRKKSCRHALFASIRKFSVTYLSLMKYTAPKNIVGKHRLQPLRVKNLEFRIIMTKLIIISLSKSRSS